MENPPDYDQSEELLPQKIKLTMMLATGLAITAGTCAVVYAVYFMFTLIVPTLVISAYLMIPGLVLMLLGVLFPFFTLLGCRGAVKEDMIQLRGCYLAMCIFIGTTLILAVYISAATFSNVGGNRGSLLHQSIEGYHDDLYMAGRINTIQKMFKCCGVNGIMDWNNNKFFKCDVMNPDIRRCNVPSSCCIHNKTHPMLLNCGARALNQSTFQHKRRDETLYTDGCQKKIDFLLFSTALDLIVIILFLLACEALVLRLCSYTTNLFQRCCYERTSSPHYNHGNVSPIRDDML